MKHISSCSSLYTGIILLSFLSGCNPENRVIPYPAPPGLVTSPDFKVKVNGTAVWVERVGGADMEQQNPNAVIYRGELEDMNIAAFSCAGQMEIKITVPENIKTYLIRPKSRNIKAKVDGRELSFSIPGPQKLYIEIDNLPHLAIFADPPEINPPKEGDAGVVYYGPGNYDIDQIDLQSNQTVYIAAGAIVKARVRGKDLQNVRIIGRGMLQGNVRISGTTNLIVDGIFIRNTAGWTNTLTDCRNCMYSNVKVFSYGAKWGLDGINPVSSRNFMIDNCFLRCRDDCVAIKSMNPDLSVDSILVTNNVMVGWACSDGVTIGFELNGSPVQNIKVRNCDILYARSGGMTGGHSGFSIVSDGPAWVQNVWYEDIRIEEQIEFKNLELIVTPGKYYGEDPPGHIKGIYMKNISWENTEKPFIISGFSADNMVENVIFDHCTVGGKILTDTTDANFIINKFTRDIKFISQ